MRRRFIVGCALACALLFTAAAGAAPAANFAGTWVLDKTKSKDLPRMLVNVESYALTVTQDEKRLTVDYKMDWKGGTPPSPGGGGQGGGGGGTGRFSGIGMPLSVTYQLDGKETTSESSGGRPMLSTLKAEWKDDGKALELTTTRQLTTREGEQRSIKITERWELSADGKTLTINRSNDAPRGTTKSTLVFNKQ